ncbi:hypothetical protein LXL04_007724 [Taraxacum kok-saghyz]
MRRRQFYSANAFVSGNRTIRNFFSKRRLVVVPARCAGKNFIRRMVSFRETERQ